MPTITEKNRAIWQALYNAADELQALKPWKWMYEGTVFAVQSPYSNNTGYCSVMGNAGEHYALGIYLNKDGVDTFLEMREVGMDDEEDNFEYIKGLVIYEQHCYMVSFETKKYITEDDEETMKQLNRTYKPRTRRPQIRYHQPYYVPWYLSDIEAEELTAFIEQSMVVLKMVKDNSDFLSKAPDIESFYTRVPQKTANGIIWTEKWIDPFEEDGDEEQQEGIPNAANGSKVFKLVDSKQIESLKKNTPQKDVALIMAMCPIQTPLTSEKENKPFYPQLIFCIDYETGEALMTTENMETAILSPAQLANDFDKVFFAQLDNIGYIPAQIIVNQEHTENLLTAPCRALGIELIYDDEDDKMMAVDFFIAQINRLI